MGVIPAMLESIDLRAATARGVAPTSTGLPWWTQLGLYGAGMLFEEAAAVEAEPWSSLLRGAAVAGGSWGRAVWAADVIRGRPLTSVDLIVSGALAAASPWWLVVPAVAGLLRLLGR